MHKIATMVMAMALAMPSLAQQQPPAAAAQPQLMDQLKGAMGKNQSSEALGQVIVLGSLLGCTQKTAGNEATQTFYHQMEAIGKTVEGYCRAGEPTKARALLLGTFEQNQNNAVVKSALTCYDAQTANIAALAGAQVAATSANYARWVRDPKLAAREMKETDVCKNQKAK